jgi:phage shock protein C
MAIDDALNKMVRSKADQRIFGICGGLAHATGTPSWVWRAGFVISVFLGGLGVFAYLVLWIFMPAPKEEI